MNPDIYDLSEIRLDDPEDVGFRCRHRPADDGLGVVFVSIGGAEAGVVAASGIEKQDQAGLKLVLDAVCHAVNSGTHVDDIIAAIDNVRSFLSSNQGVGLAHWESIGLDGRIEVAYLYVDQSGRNTLKVYPDRGSELVESSSEGG